MGATPAADFTQVNSAANPGFSSDSPGRRVAGGLPSKKF